MENMLENTSQKREISFLKSLKSELTELDKLCNEMMAYVVDYKLFSWRFPGKLFEDINCMEVIVENSKENDYIIHLELLIDRVHVILNLSIYFLQKKFVIKEWSTFQKETSTISILSQKLLQVLRTSEQFDIDQNYSTNLQPHINQNITYLTIGTQTDERSKIICDSCHSAQTYIIRLLNEVELYCESCNIKSSILETRKNIKENIFDITKIGIMNKLISALSYDIMKIFEKFATKSMKTQTTDTFTTTEDHYIEELIELKKYRMKLTTLLETRTVTIVQIKGLEAQIEKCNTNVKLFEESCSKLNKKLIHLKNINGELNDINKCLKDKIKSQEYEQKNIHKELEKVKLSLSDCVRKTEEYLNDNCALKEQLHIIKNDFANALLDQDTWKSNYKLLLENQHVLNNEKETLSKELLELQHEHIGSFTKWRNGIGIVKAINSKLSDIETQCATTLLKIQKSYKGKIESQNIIIKKFKDELSRCDKILNISNCKEDTRVQGDPIADMERQHEANLLSIRILEQRNKNLRKVIDRIRKQKLEQ